jgi:hypothetical protein
MMKVGEMENFVLVKAYNNYATKFRATNNSISQATNRCVGLYKGGAAWAASHPSPVF